MRQIQLFFFTAMALTVLVAIADLGSALAQTNPVRKEDDPNLQRTNERKQPEARVAAPACDSGVCDKNVAPTRVCGPAQNETDCIRPNGQKEQPSKSSPAATAQ